MYPIIPVRTSSLPVDILPPYSKYPIRGSSLKK